MPPKVRCSSDQKRKLIEYMATHSLFANGEYGGPLGARTHETQWAELAELLRDFGPEKSVAAWKTTWRDLKRKARGENAAARRATAVTGNYVAIPSVGEDEQLILSVIGVASSEGVGPPESQIGYIEEASSPLPTSPVPTAVPATPAFTPLAPWDVAGPLRASTRLDTYLDPARYAAPAPLDAHATHAAPASHAPSDVAGPSPARYVSPASHAAPATHGFPARTASRHTTPAPASARPEPNTRTRNRMTEPASFLLLQQEQNNVLKDIRDELRRSNELRERHLQAVMEQNRIMANNRNLEETQMMNFEENLE